jgi:hypothetical protein
MRELTYAVKATRVLSYLDRLDLHCQRLPEIDNKTVRGISAKDVIFIGQAHDRIVEVEDVYYGCRPRSVMKITDGAPEYPYTASYERSLILMHQRLIDATIRGNIQGRFSFGLLFKVHFEHPDDCMIAITMGLVS